MYVKYVFCDVFILLFCQGDPDYVHLSGIPKALLPGVGGKRILDFWWQAVNV